MVISKHRGSPVPWEITKYFAHCAAGYRTLAKCRQNIELCDFCQGTPVSRVLVFAHEQKTNGFVVKVDDERVAIRLAPVMVKIGVISAKRESSAR
jgi:hypothetical protein